MLDIAVCVTETHSWFQNPSYTAACETTMCDGKHPRNAHQDVVGMVMVFNGASRAPRDPAGASSTLGTAGVGVEEGAPGGKRRGKKERGH